MWEDPGLARFLNRLASFSRLITFDKRGTGLSDSVPLEDLPTLEVRMDDLRAVMDAVGSERAVLFGHSEGGAMCMLFAATYPERCDSLILTGSYAAKIRSDEYPWAPSTEDRLAEIEAIEQTWGDPEIFSYLVPSRADDQVFQAWLQKYQRLSASPRAAGALMRMNSMIDLTAILPSISGPDPAALSSGRPRRQYRRRPLYRLQGPRREACGATRRRPCLLGWQHGVAPRGDRGIHHGSSRCGWAREGAGHRPLHRHRRFDQEGGGAG